MEKNTIIPLVGAILAFIAAALGVWNTRQTNSVEASLKQLESDRQLMFKLYDSIVATMGSDVEDRPQRIRALRVLVGKLADESVREGFLSALDDSELEVFKTEEATKVPVLSSVLPPRTGTGAGATGGGGHVADPLLGGGPRTTPGGDANIDVFWCSRSGATAEAAARELADVLAESTFTRRTRARVLPEAVRVKPGYDIEGNVIRAEADEMPLANRIKAAIEAKMGASFEIQEVKSATKTPNYLSVFMCPEGKMGFAPAGAG